MLKSEFDVLTDIAVGRLEWVLPEWDGGEMPLFALYASDRHLTFRQALSSIH